MTVETALARGRAARQLLMRDTITITRVTGSVLNTANGQVEETTAPVYTGPADVKPRDLSAREEQAGQREQVQTEYDVALPWSTTTQIKVDDRLTVTASDDATLADRVLTVVAVGHGGRRTAHHLTAEDRS